MSSDLDKAFLLASEGQGCLDNKQYRDAAVKFVQAVGLFENVISSGVIKDEKSVELIQTQVVDMRKSAVSAQDLAGAATRNAEERLLQRLENLKKSTATRLTGPAVDQLRERLEKLKGPQKPTPSMGSIQERFDALRGPPKRIPEESEIMERLNALGPSQFQGRQHAVASKVGDSTSNSYSDQQLDDIVSILMESDMEGVDQGELRRLVGKALALDVKDYDVDVDVVADQYGSLLDLGASSIDDDEVNMIIQQAKDELIYAPDVTSSNVASVTVKEAERQYDSSEPSDSSDSDSDDSTNPKSRRSKKGKKKKKGWW